MDPLSIAGTVSAVISISKQIYRTGSSVIFFTRHYGPAGWVLCVLGNRDIWRLQLQVLYSTDEADAMNFKKAAQDESNIIAVAVSAHRPTAAALD
jgi:hypothetical protein